MSSALTVLVVDDDASIRMLCRVNLELEGFRVLEAGSLERARRLLADEPVDAALLDVRVGNADGRTFLAELRREHPGLAVAFLSGTDREHLEGADAVIPKPFTLEQLRNTVERLVGARR